MSTDESTDAATHLDVRELAKPERHPAVFEAFAALPVDGSLMVVNDHDPVHLREEFEAEQPGSHRWEYVGTDPGHWRIRVTKLAQTALPRVLVNTGELDAEAGSTDVAGAAWKLQIRNRDLDSNIIALKPGDEIKSHDGPELDVMIHVLGGSGTLTTESGAVDLRPGALVWMPRRSRRAFTAGSQGLRYLTVHQRKPSLQLRPTRSTTP